MENSQKDRAAFNQKVVELRDQMKLGGGQKRIDAQHEKGKKTARERIEQLLDSGTFQEINGFMPYSIKPVSPIVRILFPITVTVVVSLIAPKASPLIASLMFGNLIRECGVVDRLNDAAQNELANLTTLFLGLVVGATMGDECHNRNRAATSLFLRAIGPALARTNQDNENLAKVIEFIDKNDHFFLNLSMKERFFVVFENQVSERTLR